MERMSAALAGHLLVECFIAQGASHAFGVPGESYLAVLGGFHAHADRPDVITTTRGTLSAIRAHALTVAA